MKKQNYRSLAYAIALATSFTALPGITFAAEAPVTTTASETAVSETASAAETAADAGAAAGTSASAGNAVNGATAATETTGESSVTPETTATGSVPDSAASAQAEADQANAAAKTEAGAASVDPRTTEWVKTRPEEKTINDLLKQYEGQTIVDIVFDGAGELTQTTAKAALSMRTGDMFTVNGLNRDREAIYQTGYFYDLYPSFERVPEGVVLTYHVLENPILKSVAITGNTVETTEKLSGYLTVKPGEILNNRELHENVLMIQEQYRKDGYILAKISDLNIDPDGNLLIKINEGKIEGFKVKGNEKTKERVILREMRQKPGEPFNTNLARRSMQRVYNLGFFEDVNVKLNPGVDPNAIVMEIDVTEKRTGSFGIGFGYSSEDGMLGMISLADTNFRGTGDAVSITYEHSGDDSDAHGYTFSYRRPWLDQKQTVGTLKIYNRTYSYDDYDADGDLIESFMRKYSGGEITFGRPVTEYSTDYVTLKNRKDDYVKHDDGGTDRSGPDPKWAKWRNDNFGTTRSITLEHVTDTRDNIYNPFAGFRVSLSAEVAGMFGGDFDFRKYKVDGQKYIKAGHAQVFALRGQYGYGDGDISEYNQFRVGGQDTIRGYREEQFRGDHMALATLEYRFPIVSKVQGALFTDWGGAWDSGLTPEDTHASVGAGLSFNTPIGPLRFDYGRGSQGGRVHFRVGGTF